MIDLICGTVMLLICLFMFFISCCILAYPIIYHSFMPSFVPIVVGVVGVIIMGSTSYEIFIELVNGFRDAVRIDKGSDK